MPLSGPAWSLLLLVLHFQRFSLHGPLTALLETSEEPRVLRGCWDKRLMCCLFWFLCTTISPFPETNSLTKGCPSLSLDVLTVSG